MTKIKKIAVIEDEETIREVYEIKLKLSGYDVVTAEDGIKAIKIIKKEKPDLVLLDVLIPKKDGFEVLKEIRNDKDENIRSIPIIITSNLASKDDMKKAEKLGILSYIIKAKISPADIVKEIEKFFSQNKF